MLLDAVLSPRFGFVLLLYFSGLVTISIFFYSQGDEFYENGGGMGPPPRRTRGGPPRRFFNRRSFHGGYRPMPRRPNADYQVGIVNAERRQLQVMLTHRCSFFYSRNRQLIVLTSLYALMCLLCSPKPMKEGIWRREDHVTVASINEVAGPIVVRAARAAEKK